MSTPNFPQSLVLALLAGTLPVSAQEKKEANAKTTAYQTSVSQEQLRSNTRRLKSEMISLLDEYSQYQAASTELGKLKDALGQLDTVGEKDMAAVVRILREASRMENDEDTKARLVEASGAQKEIQSLLRSIADRLTLQKQEAEMRQRLDNLALRQMSNLRETKKLAENGQKPEKVKREDQKKQELNKTEQEALKKEVGLMMDALKNLAEKSGSPEKEAFEEVLKTAERNMLRNQAEQATEKLKSDFAEAAKEQEQLLSNLRKMSEELQKQATAEEKARELADKLDQLSQKQDQLAAELPKAWGNEAKQEIRKEQEKIADALKLAEESLDKINPEAARQAKQAQEQSDGLARKMEDKKSMEMIDSVAQANDEQKSIGDKLEKASEMLQQQAEELAGNEPQQSGQDQQSAENGRQQEAISNAVDQVMEAKAQMSLAKKQLQDGGDQSDAQRRLDQAQQTLQQAQREISKAGEAVPKQVGEELSKADENIGKAEEGIGVGSKQDQEKSRWSLDRANENANRALAGLQQAANQLAAQQGEKQGRQQALTQQQKGNQPGNSRSDADGSAGSMRNDKGKDSDVSAVTDREGGQREALQLLQQEKAPSEYEVMVQQYIRNLAEAAGE